MKKNLRAEQLLSAKIDRYQQSLGRFVSKFSEIEATIQNLLWHCAGVPTPTAQAIFPGVRPEAAMSSIRRIAAAQQWHLDRKKDLERVFAQLGAINKLRNDILHYGALMHDLDTWIVSNIDFVHVTENIRNIAISADVLDAASSDLEKIEHHLIVIGWKDDIPKDVRGSFDEVCKRSWQYKSQQQDRRSKTTQKTRRKQKRQHPSSEG